MTASSTVTVKRRLLERLTDSGECRFDHHGQCQEHNYITRLGETCPQADLKRILAS